jgi:hypothetical protein
MNFQEHHGQFVARVPHDYKDITLKPHSRIEVLQSSPQLIAKGLRRGTRLGARAAF